jgi:hypothetical protein
MHNGGQPKYTPVCQLSTMRNHISVDQFASVVTPGYLFANMNIGTN